MKDKKSKQVLRLAICLIMTFFGIYFTFFAKVGKSESEKREEVKDTEKNIEFEQDYSNKGLPDQENESESESYVDGKEIKVYFTNTGKLDQSSLPLEAQQILCSETQKFLYSSGFEDITEVKILDDGFQDDGKKIAFLCSMEGYEERLRITYQEKKLKYAMVMLEKIKQ